MARSRKGFVCHRHTHMVSFEVHHVWPVGYGGPNIASNKVKICCNAHSDIHYLMDRILGGKPNDLTEYGPKIRELAQKGAEQVFAHADRLAADYRSS